jgi:DNA polymerase III delta prime subunit
MARASAKTPAVPSILPLPRALADHHGETLRPLAAQWLAQNRVPPVLLLTGIAGVGKREIGYHIAQWLLCERAGFRKKTSTAEAEPDMFGGGLFGAEPASTSAAEESNASDLASTDGPCGECVACMKARQGSWVDFQEIGKPSSSGSSDDEDSDDGESSGSGAGGFERLKIESFRELKASMGFGAHEGSYRIFLIANAERLTPQAANSLLKLLEEPPSSWVLILTASDASLLLPTLVSRCQRVRLRPLQDSLLRTLLDEARAPAERQELCLQLGQGSWKRTIELADDAIWERRALVLKFLENPPEFLNMVLDWASASAESMQLMIDLMEPLHLELICAHLAGRPVKVNFLTAHIKYLEMRMRDPMQHHAFWLERAERLARARQEIRLPLNKKLLAQEILLPYLLT